MSQILKYYTVKPFCRVNGFTIIEMIVVAGLLSLFSTVLIGIFRGANTTQTNATEDLQIQSRVLTSQNKILRIIRDGKSFILPRLGEVSSTIAFIDKSGDIQVLYPEKDEKLSKKAGKDLYSLILYKVDVKTFNISNPVYVRKNAKKICEFVEDISFRLANANAVTVSMNFANSSKNFQIVFEGGLMNAGDL